MSNVVFSENKYVRFDLTKETTAVVVVRKGQGGDNPQRLFNRAIEATVASQSATDVAILALNEVLGLIKAEPKKEVLSTEQVEKLKNSLFKGDTKFSYKGKGGAGQRKVVIGKDRNGIPILK